MFMIISPDDCQVYEMKSQSKKDVSYLQELIAYSSLDTVEGEEWNTTNMFLKNPDRFNDSIINTFVTPGRMRFLLIHEGISDDNVKSFFNDVYEYYVKALLNPFVDKNTKIVSPTFDQKVTELMRKNSIS